MTNAAAEQSPEADVSKNIEAHDKELPEAQLFNTGIDGAKESEVLQYSDIPPPEFNMTRLFGNGILEPKAENQSLVVLKAIDWLRPSADKAEIDLSSPQKLLDTLKHAKAYINGIFRHKKIEHARLDHIKLKDTLSSYESHLRSQHHPVVQVLDAFTEVNDRQPEESRIATARMNMIHQNILLITGFLPKEQLHAAIEYGVRQPEQISQYAEGDLMPVFKYLIDKAKESL